MMNAFALPKLQEWEQFDSFASLLERLGWKATQKADGPDARSWSFTCGGELIWLVFDDMLGGSLKSDNPAVNLEAVAVQLETAWVP